MQKKIIVLGSTGMLGNAVGKYFIEKNDYQTIVTFRNPDVAYGQNQIKFDALKDPIDVLPSDADYIINCIGIIKPFMEHNIQTAILLNALFPLKLSEWCRAHDIKLIHISTDCVYSGVKGKYVESDEHDPRDAYGKTKSLGEDYDNAMVLRTSIIGEEIHKNASLIAWAKSQKGKRVSGYINHYWNGLTTKEYACVCDKIIRNDWYQEGLYHIFAADDICKYDMLKLFNEKFGLNLAIEKFEAAFTDRTLRTEKTLCRKLQIPSVKKMIEEM